MDDATARELVDDAARKLLAGDHPYLATLREQYDRATVDVETTGAGLYAHFEVPDDAGTVPVDGEFRFGGVVAELEGLRYGMGFLAFVADGRLSMLEGYTYEEPLPERPGEVCLRYLGDGRDPGALFPE